MKETHIHFLCLMLIVVYGGFIIFLNWTEPRTFGEISTKGQVAIGAYEIDEAKFSEGLQAFRQDNFPTARDYFAKADPERRDAKTQFYIAYSFYRQGWGRISNDDALFKQGLDAAARVNQLDQNFKSVDGNLQLKTPAELRAELEEGLKLTADDFNPLKLTRERK